MTGADALRVDWSGPAETEAVVLERVEGRVAILTLRAEPLGVLRQAVKRALLAALVDAEADIAVRALVLTGSGRAFSVGSDVREFQHDEHWLAEAAAVDQALAEAFEDSRLPVIAAINGHCLGGGLELALACDIRIAAASARLGLPEAHVGAFPAGGGTQRLPRVVGGGRALEMMLSGRIVDADEALRIGLVERVVADDELLDAATTLAADIARLPVSAVAAAKRAVQTGMRSGHGAGLAAERELAVAVGLTEDAVEGQRAFVEKREPQFGDGADWVRTEVARRRQRSGA